jgi:hypothetical protein
MTALDELTLEQWARFATRLIIGRLVAGSLSQTAAQPEALVRRAVREATELRRPPLPQQPEHEVRGIIEQAVVPLVVRSSIGPGPQVAMVLTAVVGAVIAA